MPGEDAPRGHRCVGQPGPGRSWSTPESAGLRAIRFHDLRHSTATLLLEQGVDLVVIKELLGHAHIGVTASVYAHVRLRLQRQAIDTLGNALGPTDAPMTHPPQALSADVAVSVAVQHHRSPVERP
ncbi:tyrosine-type recombinase/integrase [Streptomyces bobili]|uniref:tyrosine-type recombinase/integrase n=1 Tax=Streptomyces bobili TaxID=67280 RepID=UPI0036F780F1